MRTLLTLVLCATVCVCGNAQFINELHYDNIGPDVNETVEVVARAGTDLTSWSLAFYNGKDGQLYKTVPLSGRVRDTANGFGFVHVSVDGIQNGVKDGVALVDANQQIVEFLSYEGTLLAKDGPARGVTSVEIGVRESSSTPTTHSLQRVGTGTIASDFSWAAPSPSTFGGLNSGQLFDYGVFINELHYDNARGDRNEAVELAARSGTDLAGWQLVFYNGKNQLAYKAVDLSGTVSDAGAGWGFAVFNVNGIQNGDPDGVALVRSDGAVAEFLSYEGGLTAKDGPASGISSTDIGVREDASTPASHSLQRSGTGYKAADFRWTGPSEASFGVANGGQVFLGTSTNTPPVEEPAPGGGGGGTMPQEPIRPPSSENPTTAPAPVPIDGVTKIFDIQGRSHTSPLVGNTLTTVGTATAASNNGFYLQDPLGDGDEATSDALFVYTNGPPNVKPGDSVRVSGKVEEYIPGGARYRNLGTTQLRASENATVLSSGLALPEPVVIGSAGLQEIEPLDGVRVPPRGLIDDDAFASFEPTTDALDFFESLEGMRVRVRDPMTISRVDRFGSVWVLTDNGFDGGERLSARGALTIAEKEFNGDRIQIDVHNNVYHTSLPNVPPATRLEDVVGVLTLNRGSFEVVPTEDVGVVRRSRIMPQQTRFEPPADNRVLIASMNVLNLDLSDNPQKFEALGETVARRLATPDIVALQEVQDNDGPDKTDVVSASEVLAALIKAISDSGGPQYTAIDNTFIEDDQSGGQPGGNIRVAYLYNAERVTPVPSSIRTVRSASFRRSRLPLVAKFTLNNNGGEITVINVHFSSKGGSAPDFGVEQPFELRQDDPTVNSDVDERLAQANAVRDAVAQFSADKRQRTVITGDFNEFEFNAPLRSLVDGVPELQLLTDTLPRNDRYTYNFNGNAQVLDHFFAGTALNAEMDIVHAFSEFADAASDHDPIVLQITVDSASKFEL